MIITQRVIYPSEGGVGIIFPTGAIPTHEVARKDVPAGSPYFIVENDQLPQYWTSDAWVIDWSEPDGYGIGPDAWFLEQEVTINGI